MRENGIWSTHHIKQNTITRLVSLCYCIFCPILGSQTPGILVVTTGPAIILQVGKQDINSDMRLMHSQLASNLQQDAHSARTIISSIDGMKPVIRIRVIISPRAGVPMCQQKNAILLIYIIGSHDIPTLQQSSIPCLYIGFLLLNFSPKTTKHCHKIITTQFVCLTIWNARSKFHLFANICISRVCLKGRRLKDVAVSLDAPQHTILPTSTLYYHKTHAYHAEPLSNTSHLSFFLPTKIPNFHFLWLYLPRFRLKEDCLDGGIGRHAGLKIL